jgi:hypothetical protein
MVKEWGLTPENPLLLRYTVGGSGESLESMSRSLDGATVENPTSFHVACTTLFEWSAPCAKLDVKFSDAGKGKIVVFPRVTCMDLFVEVDGKAQEDGLMIKHNASYTDPCVDAGPPAGAWCTLVSECWSGRGRDPNAVHFPLVIKGDPTAACLNASHDYATELNAEFCQLVARQGPGLHSYKIRLSPRGYIENDDEYGPNYWSSVSGQWKCADEATKKFCANLDGETFAADPNNPKLSACFKLSVDAEVLEKSMADAQKPAPEAIDAKEYKEIAEKAKNMAGRAVNKASDCRGEAVSGPPDHVILAKSRDYGNDVGFIAGQGAGSEKTKKKNQYYFVYVYFLWKGSGDDGVMVRVRLEKHVTRNYSPVGAPDWELSQVYSGEKIKNAQIDNAIQRDAGRF